MERMIVFQHQPWHNQVEDLEITFARPGTDVFFTNSMQPAIIQLKKKAKMINVVVWPHRTYNRSEQMQKLGL